MSKKRIFVAISASLELQQKVAAWQKPFKGKLPDKTRWIKPANLHITLVPPWYEEKIEGIKNKLASIKFKPGVFKVVFKTVSCGPKPQDPRLIWASGETPQALIDLKKSLDKTLGIAPLNRDFKLHLTIARFRPQRKLAPIDQEVLWEEKITQFALMESKLSLSGAIYTVLQNFALG